MPPELPPPDPFESCDFMSTPGAAVSAPTAVFAMGPATPEADRIADRVLDLRPGLLIVLAR